MECSILDHAPDQQWCVRTGAHLAISVSLVRSQGALGLILADGVSMAARIAYSLAFVRSRLMLSSGTGDLSGLLLSKQTAATFAAAALLATGSNWVVLGGPAQYSDVCQTWRGLMFVQAAAVHVAVGGVCLLGCARSLLRTEKDMLQGLRRVRKGHAD